ncbi:uncharacterized protein PRCAT00000341001 [Priceomyces carsonii]|uniref:uncharacterized protein n=1 Tax=Priceomyces carsonii TaxID=28549 RepID=UPI002EDA3708|nr:unnamed protein product [Priceomyces carsonii]
MGKAQKSNRRPNGTSIEISGALGSGTSRLKKKIRDIERLLKKNNLPADVRNENERGLKALRVELEHSQVSSKAKKTAKKYHMVRFFEKKKVVRRLKQAKKNLDEVSKTEVRKDIKKARKAVKQYEIDLAYVLLYPKTEKYISLYPNAKDEDEIDLSNEKVKKGIQETEQRKRAFRKEMETLIDNGELPVSIDDILEGKAVKFDNKVKYHPTQEIDAPQQDSSNIEDDFFE